MRRDDRSAKVILLHAQWPAEYLLELALLGVDGFVSYDCAPLQLPEAIRAVSRGAVWIPADALRDLNEKKGILGSGLHRRLLTARERTVLGLLQRASCNKEIASILGVSVSTVKFHLSNIFAKLNVHDRMRAVSEANRRSVAQQPSAPPPMCSDAR
jgi:DNA-binding NarL/FixJ family response regulator